MWGRALVGLVALAMVGACTPLTPGAPECGVDTETTCGEGFVCVMVEDEPRCAEGCEGDAACHGGRVCEACFASGDCPTCRVCVAACR